MRALGIDYGRRRIGLALSDPTGLLARPWKTLAVRGNPQQIGAMLAGEVEGLLSDEDGLDVVVLGWPRRLSGEPNDQTQAVESLAAVLRARVQVPVALQDERLSSREAERLLSRTEKDWRRRKPLLDAMAASVILQDYLDGRAPVRLPDRNGCDAPPRGGAHEHEEDRSR